MKDMIPELIAREAKSAFKVYALVAIVCAGLAFVAGLAMSN